MRLIDADVLAKEIEEKMNNGFPANEYLSLYAMSCIAHAPTVDVLDKIRAEIERKMELKCNRSVLITNAYMDCLQIIDKHISGADMRGVE